MRRESSIKTFLAEMHRCGHKVDVFTDMSLTDADDCSESCLAWRAPSFSCTGRVEEIVNDLVAL